MPDETGDVTLDEVEDKEESSTSVSSEDDGKATNSEDGNSEENPELIESETETEQPDLETVETLAVPAPALTMDEEWDQIMQLNLRLIKELEDLANKY